MVYTATLAQFVLRSNVNGRRDGQLAESSPVSATRMTVNGGAREPIAQGTGG